MARKRNILTALLVTLGVMGAAEAADFSDKVLRGSVDNLIALIEKGEQGILNHLYAHFWEGSLSSSDSQLIEGLCLYEDR
jgi:hypothetical protein